MTPTSKSSQSCSLRKKKISIATEPDSTTSSEKDRNDFISGEDVFLQHKDGCSYLGTVVAVDNSRDQCLVKFGDNTQNWANFKYLKKCSPKQEDLFCVVCKRSAPKESLEITVCHTCSRGYHQNCHIPSIPSNYMKDGTTWMCKRCWDTEPLKQKKGTTDIKIIRRESSSKNVINGSSANVTQFPTSFPYDVNTLSWDSYHRMNLEHIYCYCGGLGRWHAQMLQCSRCRQWFHEQCVKCLRYPLYCGDRFYVFVCAICNEGVEFLRRLELNWVDLVHLMLFNLTAFNVMKYYDLDSVIIPYINDNWHALQLPPKICNTSAYDRKQHILSALTSNRNRFKCGREIKKRTAIWGLRLRLPPPIPCFHVTPLGQVNEDQLKQLWQNSRRLRFLPDSSAISSAFIIPVDKHMLNIMTGSRFFQNIIPSDSDSPSPSPDHQEDINAPNKFDLFRGKTGCAKKSVPFTKISLNKRKKRLTKQNLNLESKTNKSTESLPLTPPTSVSAPPTPPASSTSDYCENSQNTELNMVCDTSGDETSSKSTLDLIIPPPKDFIGQNNPFITLLQSSDQKKQKNQDSITLPLPLTAVIPCAPVARPLKRKLSEKDIRIGPNGEVKRRRFRRLRHNYTVGKTPSKTATVLPVKLHNKEWRSSATGTQINNCIDYTLNVRCLRQRHDKDQNKSGGFSQSTPKQSPVKQEPDIDIDKLKNSVNIYFGAANRIAAGEKFYVKGKRILPNGKLQYLLEWQGST